MPVRKLALFPKPSGSRVGESAMWAVMMLCTFAASLPPQPLQDASRGRRVSAATCYLTSGESERCVPCLLYIIGVESVYGG